MSDFDLVCNFKKCRKVLTETAFVTRCSHVFCEDDAIHEIEIPNAEKKCPACQSQLIQSYDLVKVVLNPTEQFKSMVLAGIRPNFVMDIANRAIMFWMYQMQQENFNQKKISKNCKDSLSQMKISFEVEYDILKSKIQDRERKIEELEKQMENQNRKYAQLSVKLSEKCGEVQRWQMAYETVRKKQISEVAPEYGNKLAGICEMKTGSINIGPETMDAFLPHHKARNDGPVPYHQIARGYEMKKEEYNPRKPDERHGFYFQPQVNPLNDSPKLLFEQDGCNRKVNFREFKH